MDNKDIQNYNCYFRAKDSLLYGLYLYYKTGEKALIIGSGTKEIPGLESADYLDNDPEALKLLKNVNTFLGSAEDLPFKNNSYDVVIMADVLEHIKEDKLAVNEVFRVLKPKGIFIFTVPAHPKLFGSHDIVLNHYRRYSNKDLLNLIPNIIFLSYWNRFLYYPTVVKRKLFDNGRKDSLILPKKIDKFIFRQLMKENKTILSGKPIFKGLSLIGVSSNI